jgi:hypothetical protein
MPDASVNEVQPATPGQQDQRDTITNNGRSVAIPGWNESVYKKVGGRGSEHNEDAICQTSLDVAFTRLTMKAPDECVPRNDAAETGYKERAN